MTDRSALVDAALADLTLFERLIEAIYRRILRPGDTAVDGGAHSGMHTLPMARLVGPQGVVHAVEPVAASLAILRRNALRDGLAHRIQFVERALADKTGPASYTVVRNATARSGLRQVPYPFEVELEHITVECVRLDDLLADAPSWRFGKFDLEGGEYHAFLGGRAAVARFRPMLAFERGMHSPAQYGYTPADFFRLFDGLGYRVCDLFGEPTVETEWFRSRRPWYALAVAAGDDDDSFLALDLPGIVDAFQRDLL